MDVWGTLSVLGPIARTAGDAAFLLSAMAGPDARSPISIAEPGARFARPLDRDFRKVRVAWSRDLGGLPVDKRVLEALAPARKVLESLGCIVEDAEPDLAGADEAFNTLRANSFAMRYGGLLQADRARIKDTVIWNIEKGLALDGISVGRAIALRSDVYRRMREFMERYEFLCLPVNQVPPFPAAQPFVDSIDGVKLGSYVDWMKSCYYITVTSHPAISVPAGFTRDAKPLPVGLQIVGRYREDFAVLQLAHAFEQETKVADAIPAVAAAAMGRDPIRKP
jgi:amidase